MSRTLSEKTLYIQKEGDAVMSKPLLLDYVCERSGDINPAYVYSRMKDMNVIKTSGGDLPFIEADHALADVHTQTRIQKETEDNDNYMNELVTKTNARRERDDEVVNCWAELLTKTDMVKERDDETLMELISKTFANRERDDEDELR